LAAQKAPSRREAMLSPAEVAQLVDLIQMSEQG
jgi:hypothetical protein